MFFPCLSFTKRSYEKYWNSLWFLGNYFIVIFFPPICKTLCFPVNPFCLTITMSPTSNLEHLTFWSYLLLDLLVSLELTSLALLYAHSNQCFNICTYFWVATPVTSGVKTPNSISTGSKGCLPYIKK